MEGVVHIPADALGDWLDRFQNQWRAIALDALIGTAVNGPLLQDIWIRTPKSMWQRYAMRMGDRLGKNASLSRSRWTRNRTPERVEKLGEYGQQRLARSFLPYRGMATSANVLARVRLTNDGFEMVFGSDVPYAERMHNVGTSGQWTGEPYGHGWTTAGTDKGFVTEPLKQDEKAMLDEFERTLWAMLRQEGYAE